MKVEMSLLQLEINSTRTALNLCDGIIEVVRKFDGKQPSKRLDTALKGIDENLRFKMEYNSFSIYLYLSVRCVRTEIGVRYLNHDYQDIIRSSMESSRGDGVCQNGTIRAELIISDIERARQQMKERIAQLTAEMGDIGGILNRFEELRLAQASFEASVSYSVREYFNLKFK